MESTVSLVLMPEWLGTQRNSIAKPERSSSYRRCLILVDMEEGKELKKLEKRLRRQYKESDTTRYRLGRGRGEN